MRFSLVMLVCLLASMQATSESLGFTIYQLSGDEQELIAEGRRDYTVGDIAVKPWGKADPYQNWLKSLELKVGFSIGIYLTPQFKDDGFGLWIHEDGHPDGFSWAWFNHDEGDIFTRGPGPARVRVTYTPSVPSADARLVEISSVEFLTDITLHFTESMKLPPGVRTHAVVVSQGSVLRFAP